MIFPPRLYLTLRRYVFFPSCSPLFYPSSCFIFFSFVTRIIKKIDAFLLENWSCCSWNLPSKFLVLNHDNRLVEQMTWTKPTHKIWAPRLVEFGLYNHTRSLRQLVFLDPNPSNLTCSPPLPTSIYNYKSSFKLIT